MKKTNTEFRMLGKFIARCILDFHKIDLDLSLCFLSRVLDKTNSTKLEEIDPQMNDIMGSFNPDDFDVFFTFPGTDTSLIHKGRSKKVNHTNLQQYRRLVYAKFSDIIFAVSEFKSGFNSLLPLHLFQIFSSQEFKSLFYAFRTEWTEEYLRANMSFGNGMGENSQTVQILIKVLLSLNEMQKKKFLIFVSASTCQLHEFEPKLCIASKVDGLPSVMTCATYLKVRSYDSFTDCHRELLMAITDGAGSFQFS